MKDVSVNYEVEFFNISEVENIHTGETGPMPDVDINDPLFGRYNIAKVTETEYGTSRYYLLLTTYCTEGPESPTLETLLAYLMCTKKLSQNNKDDVYKAIDSGETVTAGECFAKIAKMLDEAKL